MTTPPYVVFFEGQGGPVFSTGMLAMASRARSDGIYADVMPYTAFSPGRFQLLNAQRNGSKIAAVGMSLGGGDVELLTYSMSMDLLIGLDPSRDGINYKIRPNAVKKSILFHNNNILGKVTGIGDAGEASDPGGDLGYQIKIEIDDLHILDTEDPRIQARIRQELLSLK